MNDCAHCNSEFDPRRKDQMYCSTKCKQAAKDQRRKPKRLERDRERNGVEAKDYRRLDPDSIAAKFGFEVREEEREEWDY